MIGKKIKELLKVNNIKQTKLAKHLQISPSRLSNYLSDKREPDIDMLSRIAKYLGTDLNYFSNIKFSVKAIIIDDNEIIDNDQDIVKLGLYNINSKKRSVCRARIAIDKFFLTTIDNPASNARLLFVTNSISKGRFYFKENDVILCRRFTVKALFCGASIIDTGRNWRIYSALYNNDSKSWYFYDKEDKQHVFKDESGLFIMQCIFRSI